MGGGEINGKKIGFGYLAKLALGNKVTVSLFSSTKYHSGVSGSVGRTVSLSDFTTSMESTRFVLGGGAGARDAGEFW